VTTTIPIIDLTRGDSGTSFVTAYERYGFAQIVGHGIPDAVLAAAFDASHRFHSLPVSDKQAVALNEFHRGYIGLGTSVDVVSTVDVVDRPNESESFMMLGAADPGDVERGVYLAGPNQWPIGLPGFRNVIESYAASMTSLGHRMIDLLADELGDGEVLAAAFRRPTTWLRLLLYPKRTLDRDEKGFGSAPHRDFGALTILAQDDAGGLEVRTPNGEWVAVPPMPGAFVVNVGDMLHRWSNGRLLSTPHRVLNPSGRERYSIPFFFDPHVETTIEPLASCVPTPDGARFEPIEFGDEVRRQLTATYEQHRVPDADGPTDRPG